MAVQQPPTRSRAAARHPRRVILAAVIRRDAAQRLSLALTLLARAANEDAAHPRVAITQPADGCTATGHPTSAQEEQSV